MNARVIIFTLFSAMLAVGSLVAAEPQHDPRTMSDVDLAHRSLSAIQADLRAALRAEACSRRLGENTPDVLRLIDLYREMAAHPKRDTSRLLHRLGLQLRSRLENVCDHVERQNAHSDRQATKRAGRPPGKSIDPRVLAQQIAIPGGAARGQRAQSAANRPGAAATVDYGPDLVELIQQTISPATWDINGGNGSIVYFAPLQVIVVSAPATTHDQIGDVLGQLRAAP